MTKQAQLTPIDPSYNSPLNPAIPNQDPQNTFPVSVEAINGFFNLAREDLGIKDNDSLAQLLKSLAASVHPLVLGETYRIRNQIKMLAKRLLQKDSLDEDRIEEIVNFLTSDSGSHNYTNHTIQTQCLVLRMKFRINFYKQ